MSTKSELHNHLANVIDKMKDRKIEDEEISMVTSLFVAVLKEGVISDDYAMDLDLKLTLVKNMIRTKSGDWVDFDGGYFPISDMFGKMETISKELVANRFVSNYSPTFGGSVFQLVHKDKAIDYLILKLEGDMAKISMVPPGTIARRSIDWLKPRIAEIVQQVTISIVVTVIVVYLIK